MDWTTIFNTEAHAATHPDGPIDRFISGDAWYGIQFPPGWYYKSDPEKPYSNGFWFSGKPEMVFRLSVYQSKSPHYSFNIFECYEEEKAHYEEVRIISTEPRSCVYLYLGEEDGVSTHGLITGEGRKRVLLMFAVENRWEEELPVEEYPIAFELLSWIHFHIPMSFSGI